MPAKLLSAERFGWDCVFRVHLDDAQQITVVDEPAVYAEDESGRMLLDSQGRPIVLRDEVAHQELDPAFVRTYTFGPPTKPAKMPKGMEQLAKLTRDDWRAAVWPEHEKRVAEELRILVAHEAAQLTAQPVTLTITL